MSVSIATLSTAWQPVAVRVSAGSVDAWDWHLTPYDQSVFRIAVAQGGIVTAQRRTSIGFELLARRTTPTTPSVHSRRALRAPSTGAHP